MQLKKKKRVREFVANRPTLQEILKEVLYTKIRGPQTVIGILTHKKRDHW